MSQYFDQFGRPIQTQQPVDQFGRPIQTQQPVDQFGRPVQSSPQMDQYGRPMQSSPQMDQYGRSTQHGYPIQDNKSTPFRHINVPNQQRQGPLDQRDSFSSSRYKNRAPVNEELITTTNDASYVNAPYIASNIRKTTDAFVIGVMSSDVKSTTIDNFIVIARFTILNKGVLKPTLMEFGSEDILSVKDMDEYYTSVINKFLNGIFTIDSYSTDMNDLTKAVNDLNDEDIKKVLDEAKIEVKRIEKEHTVISNDKQNDIMLIMMPVKRYVLVVRDMDLFREISQVANDWVDIPELSLLGLQMSEVVDNVMGNSVFITAVNKEDAFEVKNNKIRKLR